VLEIDAGRRQESLAIEIRAHAHLHAMQVLHQHKVRRFTRRAMRLVHRQQGQHVGGIFHLADVVAGARTVSAVELEHIAARPPVQEVDGRQVA